MHIERIEHLGHLRRLLTEFPVVGLIGARQVGKTTLALDLISEWQGEATRLDLEDSRDLARLSDPMMVLPDLTGLVVLDEVQRRPDLFEALRVLADRPGTPARFLVLGSASPKLLQQTSESLAGRISRYELPGLSLAEVGPSSLDRLWLRGGFPRSYLSRTDQASFTWRRSFHRTFLERDLPQLGVRIASATLDRFWSMLAHYHAQIWNASEFARAFGVSEFTVRQYVDLMVSTYMVRRLTPWHENLKKRQVKAPKLYLSDSGMLHMLLGLTHQRDLQRHPKVGASWEGFALTTVIDTLDAWPEECFFWATHTGAELDLLVVRGDRREGFEIKRTSSPRVTRSMRIAQQDLRLDQLTVIHAGPDSFPMADGIRAVPLHRAISEITPLD